MGGIKKKRTKRGIEHHKRSLEETLEAPETYGVRVSKGHLYAGPLCQSTPLQYADLASIPMVCRPRQGLPRGERQQPQQQQMKQQTLKR